MAEMEGPPVNQSQGCLTHWHDVNSIANWNVFATKACSIEVEAITSVQQPYIGSSYQIQVDDQVLAGKMQDTGDWESYERFALGTVQVKAGPLKVVLKPNELKNGVFGNLRAVVLKGEHLAYRLPNRSPDLSGQVRVITTALSNGGRLTEEDRLKAVERIPDDAVRIAIDPKTQYQEIEGFGGAFTESAGIVFSKLSAPLQREVIQAYFSKKQGHGYRLCRTHINSCDFSRGNYAYTEVADDTALEHFSVEHDREYLIPLIHAAQAEAAGDHIKLVASPWSPPAWMKTNGAMTGGGKLKPEYRDAWANYYCRYIEEYAKESIPVWGLTVQNEPAATQRWESCIYSAEEERDFVRDHLGPALHKNNLNHVKLIVWDHNRDQLFNRAKTVFDDPEASKYVWGAGFHWYVTDDFHHVGMIRDFYPDKKLLFTEGCLEGGPHIGDWSGGERYARSIINDLNHGAVGWIDWNILLDTDGGPNHVGNYCSAPIIADLQQDRLIYNSSYYYMGHFARFIRPGAKRIRCANTGTEILTTAFKNSDGSIAVVILNEQDYPIRYALSTGDMQADSTSPGRSITTLVVNEATRTAQATDHKKRQHP